MIDLLRLLACPGCEGDLLGLDPLPSDGPLSCARCGARYPVRAGIPILLPPGSHNSNVHDEIDHARGHKQRQAGYYDRDVAAEFEISRPHGAPAAYRWIMETKFRRSIEGLPPLGGATIVDACSGSGMDAEMLARRGARVIAVDISEGCARRAVERARRSGSDYFVVVGDVERLPLRTDSADIAYVHDGLHHLADPASGLRELARVARRAVSVTEPADALGTQIAVRLGVSTNVEDAGNGIARLTHRDVAQALEPAGFDLRSRRYLMYYRHQPGPLMRLASLPGAHQAYRVAARAADAAIGRWGNKLQVTALRRAA